VQEQVDDRDLAGLARPRAPVARPVASADPTVLAPAPAPLDCPYLHLDDDGPSCLALPPAIRLARRQVEIVCAVAAHMACPRLVKAEAGRVPVVVEPPEPVIRRRERVPDPVAAPAVAETADTAAAVGEPAITDPAQAGALAAGVLAELPAQPSAASPPVLLPVDEAPTGRDPSVVTRTTSAVAAPGRAVTGPAVEPAVEPAAGPPTPAVAARVAAALALIRATARRHIVLRPATAAAWLIFLAAVLVVIAVLTARGGLTLPAVATASPGVAGASPSLAEPSATAPATAGASPTLSASPSTSPSASPSPVPTASPTPSPSPSASTPFSPDQLAVLKPCPGKPACYQYRIKSGDNLHNIATFFGLTYPALLAANPQITNPSIIHVGQLVIVPFPTPAKATPTPKP
jgi:LysM repeat protein